MRPRIGASILLLTWCALQPFAQTPFEKDAIQTTSGPLEITFIGHASSMLQWGGKTVQADPYGRLADYGQFPKADLILVTHEHRDHFDPAAIAKARAEGTIIIGTATCAKQQPGVVAMKNGDALTTLGIRIEAVPAYNLVHMSGPGKPFHPKGVGNGYILTFGDKRVYIAGDTENTVEMKALKNIDVAFLPMNLPFTMTPEMVADAARAFKPKVLYPYHFGETETGQLTTLLKSTSNSATSLSDAPQIHPNQ